MPRCLCTRDKPQRPLKKGPQPFQLLEGVFTDSGAAKPGALEKRCPRTEATAPPAPAPTNTLLRPGRTTWPPRAQRACGAASVITTVRAVLWDQDHGSRTECLGCGRPLPTQGRKGAICPSSQRRLLCTSSLRHHLLRWVGFSERHLSRQVCGISLRPLAHRGNSPGKRQQLLLGPRAPWPAPQSRLQFPTRPPGAGLGRS